jgi:hypothetical protein
VGVDHRLRICRRRFKAAVDTDTSGQLSIVRRNQLPHEATVAEVGCIIWLAVTYNS